MKKYIKNSICIIAILLLGLQSCNLIIYYTLFKINQENLAKTVCEQIVKECNACCYLDKKMSEETDKENPASSHTVKVEQKISDYTVINFSNNSSNETRLISYFVPGCNLLNGYSTELTQPPRC